MEEESGRLRHEPGRKLRETFWGEHEREPGRPRPVANDQPPRASSEALTGESPEEGRSTRPPGRSHRALPHHARP